VQTCLVFHPVGLFRPLFKFTAFLNCVLFVIVQPSKRLRHLKLIALEQCREQSSTFLVLRCPARVGSCLCVMFCYMMLSSLGSHAVFHFSIVKFCGGGEEKFL